MLKEREQLLEERLKEELNRDSLLEQIDGLKKQNLVLV
jgi:hypothetical protein